MNDLINVGETINAKEIKRCELFNHEFSIYGTFETPLFLAKEVSEWIGLSNVSDMISRVDQDEVTKLNLGGLKGECNMLTENGLYEVLMQSRKPQAKDFKRGVKKILHELRTKGEVNTGYIIPRTLSEALYLAAQQAEQIEKQEVLLLEQAPKVDFYEAVTGSSDTIDMRSVATTLNCGLGRNKIFEILREKKVLDSKNKPYMSYVDRGYFRTIESSYCKPDGSECINIKTVVFQKGLDFIRKILNK